MEHQLLLGWQMSFFTVQKKSECWFTVNMVNVGRCRFSLFTAGKIVLLSMEKNLANKLRLVVYLIWSLIHPKGGCLGFLNHQTVDVLDQVDFGFILYSCRVGWSSTTNCHLFCSSHIFWPFRSTTTGEKCVDPKDAPTYYLFRYSTVCNVCIIQIYIIYIKFIFLHVFQRIKPHVFS